MPLKQVDWDKFEFRCHYFGELMTKPRGKTPLQKYKDTYAKYDELNKKVDAMKDGAARDKATIKLGILAAQVMDLEDHKNDLLLSDTCKKRLAQIYTEETTGRVKEFESIAVEKGLMTEEDSITLYSLRYGKYYKKNREKVSNGYVIGEIDFDDVPEDMVVDTKSSFDIFTFDATVWTGLKKVYVWQGNMYMWLKNRKNFRLAYCLNNTPGELLARMKKSLSYRFIGTQEEYKEACDMMEMNHSYDDLPLERKIRVYDLKRDDEKIELAKSHIPHFREHLKQMDNGKETDTSLDTESSDDVEES